MSILSHFTGTPRVQQQEILQAIEENIDKYDVFVIESPTAVGKSLMAEALAKYLGSTAILTPTNILLQQYQQDFPNLNYLYKKDMIEYHDKATDNVVITFDNSIDLTGIESKPMYECLAPEKYKCQKHWKACVDCKYAKDKAKLRCIGTHAMNYYMYLALKNRQEVMAHNLILDEAHNIIPMITDLASNILWKPPKGLYDDADIIEYIESLPKKRKVLKHVISSYKAGKPAYSFEYCREYLRGVPTFGLKVKPIDIREYKPILWPHYIKKIFLMSATINFKDIEELGLAHKRVFYVSSDSPISPVLRPTLVDPVGHLSYQNENALLPKVAAACKKYMYLFHSAKGVIHCPYRLVEKLKPLLEGEDRIIWHDRTNKMKKYREFRARKDNAVLVASGLYEGVDLVEDLGRWQIIVKCPYPSLKDSAINYKANKDETWYAWETIKLLLQASGRICRTPTDFGATIMLDKNFEVLYSKYNRLWPEWFKESLVR